MLLRTCLLLSFLFVLLDIHAQDSTKITGHKNEIGLNMGPVALVMLGASPDAQPIMLTYKRLIRLSWALRVSGSLSTFQPNFYRYVFHDNMTTDSLAYTTSYYRKHWEVGARAGVEYRRKFWSICTVAFGADLLARYGENEGIALETISGLDSTGTLNFPPPQNTSRLLVTDTYIFRQLGLGLTAALYVPLGKRFWLTGVFRLDTYGGSFRNIETDLAEGNTKVTNGTVFDLDVRPLGELGLYFRF